LDKTVSIQLYKTVSILLHSLHPQGRLWFNDSASPTEFLPT